MSLAAVLDGPIYVFVCTSDCVSGIAYMLDAAEHFNTLGSEE